MISAHRSKADPQKRSAYIQLAVPALEKGGGKILESTNDIVAKENGVKEQTVLIEFESLEKALQAYESPQYQEALNALDGGCLLYTSPSPRDTEVSRMPSSA